MHLDGKARPLDIGLIAEVDRKTTAYVRVQLEADVLEMMDLIDMPGISDPNTPPEVWKRVIGNADHVIWCTHAIQAWRQSEAATWEELPPSLYDKSLLLLTRFDKINTESDRRRVLARVRAETEGLFAEVLPISLLQAGEAGEDRAAWEASGAETFSNRLIDLLMGRTTVTRRPIRRPVSEGATDKRPEALPKLAATAASSAPEQAAEPVRRIVPRRVVAKQERQITPRPERSEGIAERYA